MHRLLVESNLKFGFAFVKAFVTELQSLILARTAATLAMNFQFRDDLSKLLNWIQWLLANGVKMCRVQSALGRSLRQEGSWLGLFSCESHRFGFSNFQVL